MIVTVTPNTAIDYSMLVPEFSLGRTIRSLDSAWGMGGKAADAAWILSKWGVQTLALGFAAGSNGRQMEGMLRERGCQTDFIWVGGETRLNTVLCMKGKHSTFTSSTLEVASEHVEAFFNRYRSAIEQASCLIVGGSLPHGVPPTFFVDVIKLARQRDIPVIFDSSGIYLQMGLEAHPTVIKPNLTELEELARDCIRKDESDQNIMGNIKQVYLRAKDIQNNYNVAMVVTLGSLGAMALFGETQYWIPSRKVHVVSAAGAGDAILAGLAVAYSKHLPIEEGLRLGFSLATAVLLTLGTADYHIEDAQAFLPLIELHPLSLSANIFT
jgi:1-phosphofructokinase family hexose kinase